MKTVSDVARALCGCTIAVSAILVGACGNSPSTTAGEQTAPAVEPLTLQYADARGVRGTFVFDHETFTGIASPSATGTSFTGELLGAQGVSLATWQFDPETGVATGVADGQPFTIEGEAATVSVDPKVAQLAQTHTGQALSALANAALATPQTTGIEPYIITLSVIDVVAGESDDTGQASNGIGQTSEAEVSCSTRLKVRECNGRPPHLTNCKCQKQVCCYGLHTTCSWTKLVPC